LGRGKILDAMDVVEDHVHIFLEVPPRLLSSRIVQIVRASRLESFLRQFTRLQRGL
jgi:REP element-mobilizing transposase RayT